MKPIERTLARLQRERAKRRSEYGFTLIEILITVFIVVLLAGVVTFAITRANSVNENVVNTTMSQAEVLNTTNALTRDIAAADKIISAGSKYIQFETNVNNSVDVVTVFSVNATGSNTDGLPDSVKALHDDVYGDGLYGVYSSRVSKDTDPATGEYKALLPGGNIDFTYFDNTGLTLTGENGSPHITDVSKIARVEFYLQSYSATGADESSVQMASSASPRLGAGTGTPGNVTDPGHNNGLPPAAPNLTLEIRYTDVPGVPTPSINANPPLARSLLSWTAVEGADSYTLYKYNRREGTEPIAVVPAGNALQFVEPDRVFGETYTYWVIASGAYGLSGRSNDPTETVISNASISGSAVDLRNTLAWAEPNGVGSQATPANSSNTGYEVYRHAVGASYSTRTLLYQGTDRSFVDTNVTYGDVWVYTVHAYNQGGTGYALNSVTLYSPPVAPVLSGTHERGVRNTSWTAPRNVAVGLPTSTSNVYELRRTSPTATSYNTSAAVRTYADNVSIDNTTFQYQVRARNATGWGPWSNTTTLTPRPLAPNVTGTHSNGVRNLTWTEATNVSLAGATYRTPAGASASVSSSGQSYQIERISPQGTTYERGSGNRNLTDDATINSDTFTYRVRAWNITGYGPWSNTVTLNPRPVTPSITVQDYVSNPSTRDNNNYVTWTTPGNATSFVFQGGSTTATAYGHNNPGYSSTHNYRVSACNITGCSGEANAQGRQAPGPFGITSVRQIKSYGLNTDPNNGWIDGTAGSPYSGYIQGQAHPNWNASDGANNYSYSFMRNGAGDNYTNIGVNYTYGSLVDPTTGYYARVRSHASNGTYREGSGYALFTAPAVSREINLGFRTHGGRASGSWYQGDATPVRGSYSNAQAYYTDVHTNWDANRNLTGVFQVGNTVPWRNLPTHTRYNYDGGVSKDQIRLHGNGAPAMRPGGQIFMRVQQNIPGGWGTGTSVVPAVGFGLDYWTPFAWDSTSGGDSSMIYSVRWSTGNTACWSPYNYQGAGCANPGGWGDVPWSTGNFPRDGLGHNSNNTNHWRVYGQ